MASSAVAQIAYRRPTGCHRATRHQRTTQSRPSLENHMSSEGSNPPASRRGLYIAAAVGATVALIILGSGFATRAANSRHLWQQTDAQADPVVTVSPPQAGGNSYTIDLPGRLEAYSRAPIYARVSGYLKDWHVDIGSHVQAGQILADIEA